MILTYFSNKQLCGIKSHCENVIACHENHIPNNLVWLEENRPRQTFSKHERRL